MHNIYIWCLLVAILVCQALVLLPVLLLSNLHSLDGLPSGMLKWIDLDGHVTPVKFLPLSIRPCQPPHGVQWRRQLGTTANGVLILLALCTRPLSRLEPVLHFDRDSVVSFRIPVVVWGIIKLLLTRLSGNYAHLI